MPAICSKCGVELAESAVFCHRCGEPIEGATPPAEDQNPATKKTDQSQSPASQSPSSVKSNDKESRPIESGTPREQFQQLASSRTGEEYPEKDVWSGTYSSRAMIGEWIVAGLVSLSALIVAISFFGGKGWIWTVVLLLLMWAALYLRLVYRQLSVKFYLTTQRFVHEQGLLRRVTDRIEVIDMDDISFEQGPIERVMGVGTIKISSSDRTHPEIVLLGIDNVKEVSRQFDDARRAERRRRGLHIESI